MNYVNHMDTMYSYTDPWNYHCRHIYPRGVYSFRQKQKEETLYMLQAHKEGQLIEYHHRSFVNNCREGFLDLIKAAIYYGIDVKSHNNAAICVAKISLPVIKLLHENGADLNARNNIVFKRAFAVSDIEVCKYLLDNGAVIWWVYQSEHNWRSHERYKLLLLLTTYGLDINHLTKEHSKKVKRYHKIRFMIYLRRIIDLKHPLLDLNKTLYNILEFI